MTPGAGPVDKLTPRRAQEVLAKEFNKMPWELLPDAISRDAMKALLNPDITSMTPYLAIMDGYAGKLLRELSNGFHEKIWAEMKRIHEDMDAAVLRVDMDAYTKHSDKLHDLTEDGANEVEKWQEFIKIVEVRGQAAERQDRHVQLVCETVSAAQAKKILDAIMLSVLHSLEHHPALLAEVKANIEDTYRRSFSSDFTPF